MLPRIKDPAALSTAGLTVVAILAQFGHAVPTLYKRQDDTGVVVEPPVAPEEPVATPVEEAPVVEVQESSVPTLSPEEAGAGNESDDAPVVEVEESVPPTPEGEEPVATPVDDAPVVEVEESAAPPTPEEEEPVVEVQESSAPPAPEGEEPAITPVDEAPVVEVEQSSVPPTPEEEPVATPVDDAPVVEVEETSAPPTPEEEEPVVEVVEPVTSSEAPVEEEPAETPVDEAPVVEVEETPTSSEAPDEEAPVATALEEGPVVLEVQESAVPSPAPDEAVTGGSPVDAGPVVGPHWQDIKCDNAGVTNAEDDSDWRWQEVLAPEAWQDVVFGWEQNRTERPDSQFPFPRSVSNFFNGPEGMDCHKLIEANGCHGGNNVECDDVNHPAGFFILNSFRKIEAFLWNMYTTLSEVHLSILSDIGEVTSTFAPIKPPEESLAIILDIVTLGFGGFAAPAWNLFVKKLPALKNAGDGFGSMKDFTNDMVKGGIGLTKDLTAKKEPALATQNKVESALEDVVGIWKDTIVEFATQLFNGETENVERLGRMIANGVMVSEHTDIPNVSELKAVLKKSIFAQLIPLAWKASQRDINPFIMDLGLTCDEATKESEKHICFEDRAYSLRSVNDKTVEENCNEAQSPANLDWINCSLLPPPGVDALDGTNWAGITEEDIVIGSIRTFRDNGNKNREEADKGREMTDDQIDQMSEDIRAPGTFTLPVCGDNDAREGFKGNKKNRKFNFPCSVEYQDPRYRVGPSEQFDCGKGSAMCAGAANLVRNCDRAVNFELIRNDDVNYGGDGNAENLPEGGRSGNCKVFVEGHKDCYRTGNEMWHDYQEIREQGGCNKCGRKYWGPYNNCYTKIDYVA
ncbi:hypothetical protein ACHAPT_008842 [Fusarium lateritium]